MVHFMTILSPGMHGRLSAEWGEVPLCLCVPVSLSAHSALPPATEQEKCYSPCCVFCRCVGDGLVAHVWALCWDGEGLINTSSTCIRDGLVPHRLDSWRHQACTLVWKQLGFDQSHCMHDSLLISGWFFHFRFIHPVSCLSWKIHLFH